jgi:transcriptional regulator with GAF, ATPase, and Fis domain
MRCVETTEGRAPVDPLLQTTWIALAASSVGRLSLTELRDHVTKAMLRAALEQAHHNYSKAAELLGVTRQSVQYLVDRHEPLLRSGRRQTPRAGLGSGSA